MGKDRYNPRVFYDIEIPSIPRGMKAVRLHKKLAFIPERGEGEELVANSPFTARQLRVLADLGIIVEKRRFKENHRLEYTLHYQD